MKTMLLTFDPNVSAKNPHEGESDKTGKPGIIFSISALGYSAENRRGSTLSSGKNYFED